MAPQAAVVCDGGGMYRRAVDEVDEVRLPALIELAAPGGLGDRALHVDADAICPRCLTWIQPEDYVRLNALDLVQHESCPRRLVAG